MAHIETYDNTIYKKFSIVISPENISPISRRKYALYITIFFIIAINFPNDSQQYREVTINQRFYV
jgi:hypothetical protein